MNNIKRSASYHKVELENIITLIRRGKYNNALKYLQEYKNNFGDSHPMYKKIEVILESFYNDNLFELIDNFNDLLDNHLFYNRGDTLYLLALLYIKNNDYLNAYKCLRQIDILDFDSIYPDSEEKYIKLYDYLIHYMDLYNDTYKVNYSIYNDNYSLKKIKKSNSLEYSFDYIIDQDNIDILDLYKYIKSNIKDMDKTFDYSFVDKYYIYIKDIGIDSNNIRRTNILKVITFPNTDKIVSFYPVGPNLKDNTYINKCNYIDDYYSGITRVRTNQIDKFNNKWGK